MEVLLMFGGQMGCEALNWILKRIIKEERPRRTSHTPLLYYNTKKERKKKKKKRGG
jgi:hypothetical protein